MEQMNSRQSWAIRCACGLDVRELDLTRSGAAAFLNDLNSDPDSYARATRVLLERGAKGGVKPFKPYVKGEKKPRKTAKKRGLRVVKGSKRSSRDTEFQAMYDRAYAAGAEAAANCTPTPMIVQEHANPLDDNSPVVKTYAPVMGGVCGFARVEMPANTAFSKYLVEQGLARRGEKGIGINIWDYNQSYEMKLAHAHAMARDLYEQGVKKVRVWDHID